MIQMMRLSQGIVHKLEFINKWSCGIEPLLLCAPAAQTKRVVLKTPVVFLSLKIQSNAA
jgi:hypothetical protein